jgi:hypothetical protein
MAVPTLPDSGLPKVERPPEAGGVGVLVVAGAVGADFGPGVEVDTSEAERRLDRDDRDISVHFSGVSFLAAINPPHDRLPPPE